MKIKSSILLKKETGTEGPAFTAPGIEEQCVHALTEFQHALSGFDAGEQNFSTLAGEIRGQIQTYNQSPKGAANFTQLATAIGTALSEMVREDGSPRSTGDDSLSKAHTWPGVNAALRVALNAVHEFAKTQPEEFESVRSLQESHLLRRITDSTMQLARDKRISALEHSIRDFETGGPTDEKAWKEVRRAIAEITLDPVEHTETSIPNIVRHALAVTLNIAISKYWRDGDLGDLFSTLTGTSIFLREPERWL